MMLWHDPTSDDVVAPPAPAAALIGTLVALVVVAGSAAAAVVTLIVLPLLSARTPRRLATTKKDDNTDDPQQQQQQQTTPPPRDEMKISKCPNPDCVRCRRYGELNASARRRLPWIVSSLTKGGGDESSSGAADPGALARIVRAVKLGPDPDGDGDAELSEGGTPPAAPGQRPTVLLVRGLAVGGPIVTALHRGACDLLEDGCWRERILGEYRAASAPRDVDVDGKSSSSREDSGASASWLRNDTASDSSDPGGRWDVLHLLNQGAWVHTNASACPNIVEAVRSLPGLMDGCAFGNAFVSVLRPGTVIEPHCGPSNVRHRLHFPLLVPLAGSNAGGGANEGPELRVAGERIEWTEGRCVVFDDSLVHSARYPRVSRASSADRAGPKKDKNFKSFVEPPPRVVLIVDLWHPDLTGVERAAVADLYPAAAAAASKAGAANRRGAR